MAERKSLLEKNALTTLEAVMEFLGLEPDDPEVLDITKNNLERLINSASSYLETMTGRKFARQDYVENHYGSGSQELCLNQYPIRAVEKILDVENQVILAPGSYSLSEMGDIGVVYRDSGWTDRGYIGGLANDVQARRRYLQVSYTAGYILPKDATEETPSDLPADLQMIVWQMIQQQWGLAQYGANGLSAFSISDISWTFDKNMSSQVQDVIEKYMSWS